MNSHLIPSLAFIIAIGMFFGYIAPAWSGSISTARVAIASDDKALSAATTYATQQNELAAARNAINPSDISRLTALLPDSVDNVGLILNLNALAARSGITLSNVDVLTNAAANATNGTTVVATMNPVGSVDLSLSAVGTYTALQAFLTGVERSQRLLDVHDIVVKGSDTGVYTYQMKITLYWLR